MAKKTFLAQSKNHGNSDHDSIHKLKQYLSGKRIKIIGTQGGHNYGSIDTIHKIPKDYMSMTFSGGSGSYYEAVSQLIPGKNNIKFSQFVVIENETEEEIQDYINELKVIKEEEIRKFDDQIKNEKLKIKFLKNTKNKKFDEDEFKSFKALTLLENKELTLIEKSKILAQLIKG